MAPLALVPPPPARWRRWFESFRGIWSGPLLSSSPELARYFTDGPPSHAGVAVSGESALAYPAFWAAVSLISADLASLPLILYRREANGGKSRFVDHQLYRILHDEPNPEMTSMVFRETLQAHVLVWGNAYAEIARDQAGRVAALWPLTPTRVMPFRSERDPFGPLQYRVTNEDNTQTILGASEVLHIPGLGYDGYLGYSVIAKARESLGLGLAMQQFGASFFGNGSTFGGVFVSPRALGEKEKRDLVTELKGFHQGLERAHRFVILEGGMDYKRLGVPPDDAQFLESRSFHISDIARWFKVPPHKIGDLSRATFSNIEHQAIDYVTTCLRPWATRWQQEINRKLIAPQERRIQFVEHLFADLLRGDIQSRYAAYAVGRQWGWLSADDVREVENLNPLPDGQGKIYLVPQNMWPADQVEAMVKAQSAKAAPEPTPEPTPSDDTARQAITLLEQRLSRADTSIAQTEETLRARESTLAMLESERQSTAKELAEAREAIDAWKLNIAQITDLKVGVEQDLATARALAEGEAKLRAEAEAQAHAEKTAREAAEAEALLKAEEVKTLRARRDVIARDHEAALQLLAEADERAKALGETERSLRQQLESTERARFNLANEFAAAQTVNEVELRNAEAGLERAKALAESHEQRAEYAESEHGKAKALIRDLEARGQERVGMVLASHRALIVDIMRRMIERETDRARRAQTTPEKLRHWLETFYAGHEELCVSALLPAVRIHTSWMGRHEDPEVLTRMLVRQHIEESKRQISVVADGDAEDIATSLYQLFERWDRDRVSAIADALLQKEIDRAARNP